MQNWLRRKKLTSLEITSMLLQVRPLMTPDTIQAALVADGTDSS